MKSAATDNIIPCPLNDSEHSSDGDVDNKCEHEISATGVNNDKEGNVLFNDTLNMYGYMVSDIW